MNFNHIKERLKKLSKAKSATTRRKQTNGWLEAEAQKPKPKTKGIHCQNSKWTAVSRQRAPHDLG